MPLAKRLKTKPRDLAQQIVDNLDVADIAEPVTPDDIAGPGFINIRLKPDALADLLDRMGTPQLGVEPPADPQTVVAMPSGKQTKIKEIVTFDGNQPYAYAPHAVTLTLEDEIDVSRGDMLVHPKNVPNTERELEAMLVWMSSEHLQVNRPYWVKHTTQTVSASISEFHYKVDPDTLSRIKGGSSVEGRVSSDYPQNGSLAPSPATDENPDIPLEGESPREPPV